MPGKLTRRQQEFLSQFLDLYRESKEPVHYAVAAARLKVGKITAYEMLRLLEEEGLVEAEYHRPEGTHGPGRPAVLFRPTARAAHVLRQMTGGDAEVDDEEWRAIKGHILQQLREGRAGDYEPLITDLLARIPEQRSALVYVAEMVTAILLTLESLQRTAEDRMIADRVRRMGQPSEIGLSALAGIGVALSLVERLNRRISTSLLAQSSRYNAALSELSEENYERVSDFAREVTDLVEE